MLPSQGFGWGAVVSYGFGGSAVGAHIVVFIDTEVYVNPEPAFDVDVSPEHKVSVDMTIEHTLEVDF